MSLKALDPYRWLIAGVLIFSIVAGLGWYRNSLIKEGEAREKIKVAEAVAEQRALAEAQTRNLQEVADESQAQYQKDIDQAWLAAGRAASDLARMRSKAASAEQLAGASREAASEYAADAERDIDYCGERLADTGNTAATASAAAYALYNAWPSYEMTRPGIDKYRLTLRKTTP